MQRGLSLPQGIALIVGAVLGTGVISLPGIAAGVAGPASILAWAALVVLSVPLAVAFGALGARFPDGGGVSTYARRAFGPSVATVVGWSFFVAVPLGATPAAGFAGAYVADLFGGGRSTQLATAGILISVVAVMNYCGIKVSAGIQLVLAAVLAVLLVVAIVVALPSLDLGRLTPFAPQGWRAVGTAAALLVWAFAGWEVVASLSAEFHDPERDIPRATALAVGAIGLLYLGIAFVTVTALGSKPGAAPLSDLLALELGPLARPVTTFIAVLLSVGAMNAYFAGASRLGAAMGRDGSLPVWFADGSAPGAIPRRALVVVTAGSLLTLAAIWLSGARFDATILGVTGAFTLVYVVGTASAVRLLDRGSPTWWCAVISFAATLVLLVLTGTAILGSLLVGAVALLWSRVSRRRRAVVPAAGCPVG